MEEHVPVPKRVYKTREDLEVLKFTARCRGRVSLLMGTARKAHTENRRRRIEEELRSTVKAEAPQRRVKEYQDKAAARGTKLNKKENENKKWKKEHKKMAARTTVSVRNLRRFLPHANFPMISRVCCCCCCCCCKKSTESKSSMIFCNRRLVEKRKKKKKKMEKKERRNNKIKETIGQTRKRKRKRKTKIKIKMKT